MSELRALLEHMHQPEYVHVLINPSPLWGMIMGAGLLLAAIVFRSEALRKAALVVLILIGTATWAVVLYGQRGYDRVYSMSNPDAQQWLDVHMARAEQTQYVFYVTALLALLALMVRQERVRKGLTVAAFLFSVGCVGLGGWISQAGGQVRHSEFRDGPPAHEMMPHHHHDE